MLYQGVTKRAVTHFKTHAGREEASLFSEYIVAAIRRDFPEVSFSGVTAVPLHPVKERLRGFNQAEILARAVAKRMELPYLPCLVKTRPSEDQHTLNAAKRRKNLSDTFASRRSVTGTVLLIDDVRTTGTTLNECAKVLRSAGADAVFAACLALVCIKKERIGA